MSQGPDVKTRAYEAETDGGPEVEMADAIPTPPAPRSSPSLRAERGGQVSVLELLSVLLQRWKLVLGLPLLAGLLTAVITLIIPKEFTARTAFTPEEESPGLSLPAGLAGLAMQFGVALPTGGGDSPEFYARVLKSRTLRDAVLLASFADPRGALPADSARLLDILDVKGDNPTERLEEGRKELEKKVAVRVEKETRIVTVSVETRSPTLSAAVANHFIDLLNTFNLETRQSNAQERRLFIEGRVADARRELREAEAELQIFLERNRQFERSPELSFVYDRLGREVTLKQEVLSTLNRQYEESRIEEVNDTPVLTVIDRAVPPDEKSSPKRVLSVIIATLLGVLVAVFGAFGLEFVERARETDREEFEELDTNFRRMRREVSELVARVRRKKREI